jgi:hypothetical protein
MIDGPKKSAAPPKTASIKHALWPAQEANEWLAAA